jgi:aspartate kinase
MVTVEKIGGTSMTKFHDVLNNIVIGGRQPDQLYNRILVVSAYNNVTNYLLEHKKTGEPGVYVQFVENKDYHAALDNLCTQLIEINRSFADIKLDQEKADAFINERVDQAKGYLDNLASVMASGYVDLISIRMAAREILASIGEAHSAFNSVDILTNHGISATFIDLCGFDDPDPLTIDERIHKEFEGIDFSKTLAIATGYAKGTEGIMRSFDRGYSEVTFCKIAVEVKASEAIIHKEFHLSSADPHIVGPEKSVPVGHTNYIIADQLADVGMEAIHPKASKPLELAGIDIRIKNTFEPEHPGTIITKDFVGEDYKVEMVAGTDRVIAIEVHDPMMVGEVGYDLRVMKVFKKHRISYILKATAANCITVVIWEAEIVKALLADMQAKFYSVVMKPVAVVCLLGTNMTHPGLLYRAAKALADNNINIVCLSQSMRQVNMQFVIEREDYNEAIIALNDAMCYKVSCLSHV